MITEEARARYNANRRLKKKLDPEYAATVRERGRLKNQAKKEQYAEARRRRMLDPGYREHARQIRRIYDNKYPERIRHHQLKTHYGITLDEYKRMFDAQGGRCGICAKASDKTLHVDHCHQTNKVRSLLCSPCNAGLGCYRDDPALMRLAISYLERHGES